MDIYPLSLLVLGAVLAVIAVDNWRSGNISNGAALLVLIGGIASCAARVQLSPNPGNELFIGSWLLLAGLLVLLFVTRAVPGGLVKLFIAMLPWLHPEHFFILVTLFGFGHYGLGRLMRTDGEMPAIPAIAASALLVGLFLI